LPAGYVFRAKLILMLAEGASFNTIKPQLQTPAPTIIRWKQRFLESGLDGLGTYHPGQKATVLTPALRARILSATRKKPSDGSTHWSCRKLATALGVSKDAVHRVWKEAGLKPHLSFIKMFRAIENGARSSRRTARFTLWFPASHGHRPHN
jgi:transposase